MSNQLNSFQQFALVDVQK